MQVFIFCYMSLANPPLFAEVETGPDFSVESYFLSKGKNIVAGVDEAGRGPLAGPVVAAAVILNTEDIPEGLNDSKKLTATKRSQIFENILASARVAWCALPAQVIDRINIREAALQAMARSVMMLPEMPDQVLVDGRDVPLPLAAFANAYIKGDGRSLSIAAASIVAKVVRDRMMVRADKVFPEYGFARHKGYGSALHRDAIARHGPCLLHRMSFAPMRHMDGG